MAAFAGPFGVDLSVNGAASIVRGLYVSGDFFSTLGVSTFIGRTLTPSDDSPSAPPAIVLNYAYWVRAFGAAPSVVGRTVRLDRSEEHTSELQSRGHLVCRLLLEKKKYTHVVPTSVYRFCFNGIQLVETEQIPHADLS